MEAVRFVCTSLVGTGKKGILVPDENGQYTQPIGGLDVYNSAGQWYTAKGAKALMDDSTVFRRRITRGVLCGELGHPEQKPGMSDNEYAMRILNIDEKNICVNWSEIYLDFDNYKNAEGRPMVAIIGKFAPHGIHADVVERSIKNTKANMCFSIRAFTEDTIERGARIRELKNVVTFDYVNEPGIFIAEKFRSKSLEKHQGDVDRLITRNNFERGLKASKGGAALESVSLSAEGLFKSFGWTTPEQTKPVFTRWK